MPGFNSRAADSTTFTLGCHSTLGQLYCSNFLETVALLLTRVSHKQHRSGTLQWQAQWAQSPEGTREQQASTEGVSDLAGADACLLDDRVARAVFLSLCFLCLPAWLCAVRTG
jgi:hypothetical protein